MIIMIKTLLKKQMLESFSWLFYNAKSGKLRKGVGLLGNIILYVAVFGIVAGMFFVMAMDLCEPLVAIGYGWLYFAIIGMVAIVLGAFGSVFNTHSTLYLAKDNALFIFDYASSNKASSASSLILEPMTQRRPV